MESALQGAADRKLKSMTSLVYAVSRERFGTIEKKRTKTPVQPNRRQRLIVEIRKELRNLNKAYKKASEEERIGLHELRDVQRRQLSTLRKAEQIRDNRRRKARQRAAFVANPFKFSKTLLDKEKSGELQSSMDEIQQYLADTHSDPAREEHLGDCPRLDPEAPPSTPLDVKEPTFTEVKEVGKNWLSTRTKRNTL